MSMKGTAADIVNADLDPITFSSVFPHRRTLTLGNRYALNEHHHHIHDQTKIRARHVAWTWSSKRRLQAISLLIKYAFFYRFDF